MVTVKAVAVMLPPAGVTRTIKDMEVSVGGEMEDAQYNPVINVGCLT